jgi:flagellar motor component MotA
MGRKVIYEKYLEAIYRTAVHQESLKDISSVDPNSILKEFLCKKIDLVISPANSELVDRMASINSHTIHPNQQNQPPILHKLS